MRDGERAYNRRELLRKVGQGSVAAIGVSAVTQPAMAATLTWETATEWDAAQAETGVHHEQPTGTDWAAADVVEKGYPSDWSTWGVPAPVWYAPSDEDSGTTLNDVISGNDGTYNGNTLGQTGVAGTTSPNYDGTDDFADTGYTLAQKSTVSLAAWVKWGGSSSTSEKKIVFLNRADAHIGMQMDTGGQIRLSVDVSGAGNANNLSGTTDIRDGSWHHFAVVFDNPNNTGKVYVDGTSENSGTIGNDPALSNMTGYDLGAEDESFFHWNGNIDEPMIFDSVLSSVEVSELYQAAL